MKRNLLFFWILTPLMLAHFVYGNWMERVDNEFGGPQFMMWFMIPVLMEAIIIVVLDNYENNVAKLWQFWSALLVPVINCLFFVFIGNKLPSDLTYFIGGGFSIIGILFVYIFLWIIFLVMYQFTLWLSKGDELNKAKKLKTVVSIVSVIVLVQLFYFMR